MRDALGQNFIVDNRPGTRAINVHTGVSLVGLLPSEFELATVYSVAVGSREERWESAARFARLLSGVGTSQVRVHAGCEI